MTTKNCPICGEGQLSSVVEDLEVTYKNVPGTIKTHLSVCDTCGSEIAGEEEARENKRAMINFRKRVDEMLTGEAIRSIRHKYHITQQQAADIFGGGLVAFSKYENDDIVHNTSMDRLLRVAEAVPEAFNWLNKHFGKKNTKIPREVKEEDKKIQKWSEGAQIAVFYKDVRPSISISKSSQNDFNWETQEELKLVNE